MNEWICKCGNRNNTAFCTKCGGPKPPEHSSSKEQENFWLCSCGGQNTTEFCTACGKARAEMSGTPANDVNDSLNLETEKPNVMQTPTVEITPSQQSLNVSSAPPLSLDNAESSHYESKGVSTTGDKKNYVIAGLVAVIVCLSGTGGYLFLRSSHEPSKTKDVPVVEQQSNEAPLSNRSEIIIPTADTELALGEICIGYSVDKVRDLMGKEYDITDPDKSNHKRYQYPDMEVVITNGMVTGFVSKSSQVGTKRGLHQGSSYQDVQNAYGNSPYNLKSNGLELLEYPFTSLDSKKCLLRFAIKNGRVEYVSARVWEDYQPHGNTQDIEDGKQAFINYHKAITDKNYQMAYNMLTDEWKNHRGTYESFVSGYKTNISDTIDSIQVKVNNSTSTGFDYTLIARDAYQGNKVKVQTFKGTVRMVWDKGQWKIGYAESKKVSEYIE